MSLTNSESHKIPVPLHKHIDIFSCFKMTKIFKTNVNTSTTFKEKNGVNSQRHKLRTLLYSDPTIFVTPEEEEEGDDYDNNIPIGKDDISGGDSSASVPSSRYNNNMSPAASSGTASPYYSPWNQPISPFHKSPWIHQQFIESQVQDEPGYDLLENGLIGSLVREEGHVYSLATSGDLLYTGSDSKNIRVWKNLRDFAGFKANSGLVKAIVVLGDKIFTGHQDGKIRVWKLSAGFKKNGYKRIGSLPTTKDYLKTSINPKSYVEVRRHRNVPWIKHYDAVSCMAVDVAGRLLYSGSWDKTLKVWRISDSKCVESISAHKDAVNSVVVGFDGLVFTGSADGTVKAWRRELVGKQTKHVLVETLLEQENAVTSLAANVKARVVYAGSSDGLVNFWAREKHFVSHGGVLRGHKLAVLCLAAAGSLVFSGSADKSICVWRREAGGVHTCLSVLTGHSGPVKCLAVEEDGFYESEDGDRRWTLYSGSLDKSVMVWRVYDNALPSIK